MQIRLTPRLACCCAAFAFLALFSGCFTGASPTPGNTGVQQITRVLIDSTSREISGDLYVNDQAVGFMPYQLRLDLDEVGNVMYDVDISAKWENGGETFYRLLRGSRAPVVLHFSPNGSVTF